MKASVRDNIRAFQLQFEGAIRYMYVDVLGLVTTGIGNLIDPMGGALVLEWIDQPTGAVASPAQVIGEWNKVKTARLPANGMGPRRLVLSPESLDKLFWGKIDANEALLRKRWPDWDDVPADGQLLGHSLAWAAGAGWKAPLFDQDVLHNTPEAWRKAAGMAGAGDANPDDRGDAWLRDSKPEDEAVWRAGGDVKGWRKWGPSLNPGLRPRNLANQWLAQNAAVALADGYDLERLYWPTQLTG